MDVIANYIIIIIIVVHALLHFCSSGALEALEAY